MIFNSCLANSCARSHAVNKAVWCGGSNGTAPVDPAFFSSCLEKMTTPVWGGCGWCEPPVVVRRRRFVHPPSLSLARHRTDAQRRHVSTIYAHVAGHFQSRHTSFEASQRSSFFRAVLHDNPLSCRRIPTVSKSVSWGRRGVGRAGRSVVGYWLSVYQHSGRQA